MAIIYFIKGGPGIRAVRCVLSNTQDSVFCGEAPWLLS